MYIDEFLSLQTDQSLTCRAQIVSLRLNIISTVFICTLVFSTLVLILHNKSDNPPKKLGRFENVIEIINGDYLNFIKTGYSTCFYLLETNLPYNL